MRGFIVLLIAAIAHFGDAIYIGSCRDEDDIVKAIPQEKESELLNKVFYVRYALQDADVKKAGHKCTKVEIKVENNTKKIYTVFNFGEYVIRTTAVLQTVEGKYVVKNSQNKFVKSYLTAYGSSKDQKSWQFEKELHYPGVTHNRSYYLDGDVWAFWECDKVAPFDRRNDVRFVLTTKPNTSLAADHEAVKKSQEKKSGEKGWEGPLEKLEDAAVATCESIPFEYDLV